jgi:hypothetical protein
METYVLVDSIQRDTGGVANSYTYTVKKILKGVHQVELLSAAFQKQVSCTHVVLDISEFKSPANADTLFGVINTFQTSTSNVAYTSMSSYPVMTRFDNPFDINKLSVAWRDPTGNTIPISENSFLLKISHIK